MSSELLPIETARTRLRRFRRDDLDAFVAYRALESVYRYQTWPRPYTRDHGRALIEDVREGPLLRPGAWCQLAIATREDDALIGDIGVFTSEAAPGQFELGFSLAPEFQRRGLAREAVGAWLERLRDAAGARAVVGISDRRNLPSKGLLSALGFELSHSVDAEYFGEPCVDEHYVRRFA